MNNRGRIVRTLKFQPPIPGKDIYLNIDVRMQLKAQQLLAGQRGAIVMMDPKTGAILALESSPSYDPNLFVTGISSANYSALLNDPARPLVNRTTQGIYAPASTVKPMMSIMGLNEGPLPRATAISAARASPFPVPPKVSRLAPLGSWLARRLSRHRGLGRYLFLRSRLSGRHRQDPQLHDQVWLRSVHRGRSL